MNAGSSAPRIQNILVAADSTKSLLMTLGYVRLFVEQFGSKVTIFYVEAPSDSVVEPTRIAGKSNEDCGDKFDSASRRSAVIE